MAATQSMRCDTAPWLRLGLLLCVLLAAAPPVGVAQSSVQEVPRADAIKAAFLYHFLAFTDWPDDDEGAPFTICLAGVEGERRAFEQLGEKQVGVRPVVVQWVEQDHPVDVCHVLFLGGTPAGSAAGLLQGARERGVLTVGDDQTFTHQGGMIRFFEHRNHVRFEVNLDAVGAAGLKISSRMLQLARIQ